MPSPIQAFGTELTTLTGTEILPCAREGNPGDFGDYRFSVQTLLSLLTTTANIVLRINPTLKDLWANDTNFLEGDWTFHTIGDITGVYQAKSGHSGQEPPGDGTYWDTVIEFTVGGGTFKNRATLAALTATNSTNTPGLANGDLFVYPDSDFGPQIFEYETPKPITVPPNAIAADDDQGIFVRDGALNWQRVSGQKDNIAFGAGIIDVPTYRTYISLGMGNERALYFQMPPNTGSFVAYLHMTGIDGTNDAHYIRFRNGVIFDVETLQPLNLVATQNSWNQVGVSWNYSGYFGGTGDVESSEGNAFGDGGGTAGNFNVSGTSSGTDQRVYWSNRLGWPVFLNGWLQAQTVVDLSGLNDDGGGAE